jgi:hypothetical protein
VQPAKDCGILHELSDAAQRDKAELPARGVHVEGTHKRPHH